MLISLKTKIPKFVYFADVSMIYIKSHKTERGNVTFKYHIPIIVDKSTIQDLSGQLQVRVFSSKKERSKIELKRSDIVSGNILKKIDREKFLQASNKKFSKKFFIKKSIDRPDLDQGLIDFEIEIKSSQVSENFFIEIANIKPDGSTSVVDSITVDHSLNLQKYDLPSEEFQLSVSRRGNKEICISASTEDGNVGAFSFVVRNDSNSTFQRKDFSKPIIANVEMGGLANAVIEVTDNSLPFTVRTSPISQLTKQQLGNYKEEKDEFGYETKQIPFYVSSLDDTRISFTFTGFGSEVKKIFLYRQKFSDFQREYMASADLSGKSAIIEDVQRNPQYDYTYTVDYIDAGGILRTCPNEVIVLALKLDKLAKISVKKIQNSQTINTGTLQTKINSKIPKITFEALVEYNTETLYDQIIDDIKSLGIESLISDDLKKMTNNIKPLTRVIVTRISLSTGVEEHLGIFKPGIITVENDPSDAGIFRFEVAVRSVPESLESITSAQNLIANNAFNLKSISDLSTKLIGNRAKNAGSNFSTKFFTKSSIRNSTLSYGDAASLSDIGYFSGRTGIFFDVAVPGQRIKSNIIKGAKIIKTKNGYYAKWNSSGNESKIDHFEISVDGKTYFSHPSPKPIQIFYLGKNEPINVVVNSISLGSRGDIDLSTGGV